MKIICLVLKGQILVLDGERVLKAKILILDRGRVLKTQILVLDRGKVRIPILIFFFFFTAVCDSLGEIFALIFCLEERLGYLSGFWVFLAQHHMHPNFLSWN